MCTSTQIRTLARDFVLPFIHLFTCMLAVPTTIDSQKERNVGMESAFFGEDISLSWQVTICFDVLQGMHQAAGRALRQALDSQTAHDDAPNGSNEELQSGEAYGKQLMRFEEQERVKIRKAIQGVLDKDPLSKGKGFSRCIYYFTTIHHAISSQHTYGRARARTHIHVQARARARERNRAREREQECISLLAHTHPVIFHDQHGHINNRDCADTHLANPSSHIQHLHQV